MARHARRVFSFAVLLFLAATSSVVAGGLEDCNSDETARKLRGCTAIINQGKHSEGELAIAYSRRSDSHIDSRNLDQAIADRAKAQQLEPGDANHKQRLNEVYLLRGGARSDKNEIDRAIADYSEAIRIDPTNHQAHFARSSAHIQKKEFDKAITDLTTTTQLQPNDAEYKIRLSKLHDHRAIEHLMKANVVGAVSNYTEAIRLDPTRASLYLDRGTAYARAGTAERAIADFTEAIRLNPALVEAYLRRGEYFQTRGKLAPALADFDQAIKRDPKNVTALMWRALAREESELREQATTDYRAVLTIEPSNKLAKASLDRLGSSSTNLEKPRVVTKPVNEPQRVPSNKKSQVQPPIGSKQASTETTIRNSPPLINKTQQAQNAPPRKSHAAHTCDPKPNETYHQIRRRWHRCPSGSF